MAVSSAVAPSLISTRSGECLRATSRRPNQLTNIWSSQDGDITVINGQAVGTGKTNLPFASPSADLAASPT